MHQTPPCEESKVLFSGTIRSPLSITLFGWWWDGCLRWCWPCDATSTTLTRWRLARRVAVLFLERQKLNGFNRITIISSVDPSQGQLDRPPKFLATIFSPSRTRLCSRSKSTPHTFHTVWQIDETKSFFFTGSLSSARSTYSITFTFGKRQSATRQRWWLSPWPWPTTRLFGGRIEPAESADQPLTAASSAAWRGGPHAGCNILC